MIIQVASSWSQPVGAKQSSPAGFAIPGPIVRGGIINCWRGGGGGRKGAGAESPPLFAAARPTLDQQSRRGSAGCSV
jgi:hypothetical protein